MDDDAARADPLVGKTIRDDYRVIRRIGEGGMGAVYEAEHTRIGRRVAIKCLHPQHAQNADIVRRFHREAQAAARIGNEHIVEVTDMGALPDGAPFFVLELLTGQSLSELVQKGPLSIARTVHIASQICDALEAAHVAGIVHRDLKPENVFLIHKARDHDFVKILDFGISRFREAAERVVGASTAAGSTLGTPYYMSPEQAHGLKDIDQRVDVWAMGVILYQLLTGRLPFESETYPLLVLKIVSEHPAPIAAFRNDVPAALDAVVARAIAKPRDDRFASMRELATALAPFRALDAAPVMRVPLAGGQLGHASSTPSLGGMSTGYEQARRSSSALEGSGARPSFGVMPTPPPTSSVVPPASSRGVGGRTTVALLGTGVVLAALIGTGTFVLLSTRFASRSAEPAAPAAATQPRPATSVPDAGPSVAAAPRTVVEVVSGPVAPVAPVPVASSTPVVAPVAVTSPAPAPPSRAGNARRAGRAPVAVAPPPIAPTRPLPPPPRPIALAPPPRATPPPAPPPPPPRPAATPSRPPVYVGPSRTDTTGLRPDPY